MPTETRTEQINSKITFAATELVQPWVKAGMELPRTSVVELARITRIPYKLVLDGLMSGEIILNGRIPKVVASIDLDDPKKVKVAQRGKQYDQAASKIWSETQRYERRFQFQPPKAKGRPTKRRIEALVVDRQIRKAKVVFVDPSDITPAPSSEEIRRREITDQFRYQNKAQDSTWKSKQERQEAEGKTRDFMNFIKRFSVASMQRPDKIRELVFKAALLGEPINFINWICPPGTPLQYNQQDDSLYRQFTGRQPEEGFDTDYRLKPRLALEKRLVTTLNQLKIPYNYYKIVADDNPYCLYPTSIRLDGEQPTREAICRFAEYAQRRLDEEIGEGNIQVVTMSQLTGENGFAELIRTYNQTSFEQIQPKLLPNTMDKELGILESHTNLSPELLKYLPEMAQRVIRQYGVEGLLLDKFFDGKLIYLWNESTERPIIIDALRMVLGAFDKSPMAFVLHEKRGDQIKDNY